MADEIDRYEIDADHSEIPAQERYEAVIHCHHRGRPDRESFQEAAEQNQRNPVVPVMFLHFALSCDTVIERTGSESRDSLSLPVWIY